MTATPSVTDARKLVWAAFAEHFLDSETRQELPWSAFTAVEAGFSVEEAREIWHHEVSPALVGNLWVVAGEWACWDYDWIFARMTRIAERRRRPPGFASRLRYRIFGFVNDPYWTAIERLMVALLALEPAARWGVAVDLRALANHYFDFVPPGLGLDEPGRRARLQRLASDVLLPALALAVVPAAGESADACARRVEDALRGEPQMRPRLRAMLGG